MKHREKKLKHSRGIFRNGGRSIFFSAMTLVVALVVAVPVLANPPGPGTGNVDPFQPTDAAADCNPTPTLNLNNPTADAAPVPVTCDPPGPPTQNVTVTWVSDTLSGSSTDDAWGQGDKSDCFLAKTGGVNGACVTQVYGIGAAKTDLQYHGIGLEKGSNGHQYLYSGIKRLQAGGVTSSNANYNVEVNQLLTPYKPANPICPLVAPNTGGCNFWRSPGDLTFMTDWGGNQSSCNVPTPAICAYVWIDTSVGVGKTPNSGTCFSASAPPCWGTLPGGSAQLSANPDLAAGSINSGAAVQPSTFSEIGVDLTQAGLVPPGACETFRNVWAHSRSSSSFTAELKDFIFGDVTVSTCSTTTTVLHERTDSTGATDVDPANNGLDITVGLGAWVNDIATVAPSSTGNVNFRYYGSLAACQADTAGAGGTDVSTNALSSSSATSTAVQFSTVGNFYWRAFYLGGSLSASASPCNEIVHVIAVNTAISTAPWYYPNDKATISAPNGGGNLAGSITFKLYDNATNCATNGATGLLYSQAAQTVSGAGPLDFNTSNTSVKVSTTTTVYWNVTFASTNTSQIGRNSVCVESINATLTGDTGGSVGNTPTP